MTAATIAAVAIGRNEGARLQRCLRSLVAQGARTVYVDSGSTDGSVAFARTLGVTVVELDTSVPFTAARARNAGFAALEAEGTVPDLVQFVDGDCGVAPGWIAAAAEVLGSRPDVAIVTGWRTEARPAANAYHAMVAVEWHQPAGEIAACGGDMMVRSAVFRAVGGFSAGIIASEDEDFVIRVRKAGHRAIRLPQVMTIHDIAMDRLGQWWQRNLRSGHGFAEVGDLHPPHFRGERRRALLYGIVLPILVVGDALAGLWWAAALAFAAIAVSYLRILRWLSRQAVPRNLLVQVAGLFVLSKLPQAIGMIRYRLRRLRSRTPQIIEYK